MGNAGGVMMAVCVLVLAFIIMAYPVIKLIGWWLDGGVEPLHAILAIGLYMALACSAVAAPSGLKIVVLLVLVASAVMMPLLGEVADKVQNKAIDDERMHQYARALDENPLDPVARIALAEELYKRGEREQAREHMEWTLHQFPKLAGRVQPVLARWQREAEREHVPQPVICHMCYAENVPGATFCEQCGVVFGTRGGIEQRIAWEGGPKAVVRGWIVTAGALLIAVGVLIVLPIEFAAPIIAASVLVGAFLFVKWVGGTLGTAGD